MPIDARRWIGLVCVHLCASVALAASFWIEKPPADWTDDQVWELLNRSPWAQSVPGPGKMPEIRAYLATATPIQQAEAEQKRRGKDAQFDPFAEEYREWIETNRDSHIILAIRVENTAIYSDAKEVKQMEEECFLRVGRNKIKMTGYFPPTPPDPFLRIAFPRKVSLSDKELRFELYLPGITGPYREVQFRLEPMVIDGKLDL